LRVFQEVVLWLFGEEPLGVDVLDAEVVCLDSKLGSGVEQHLSSDALGGLHGALVGVQPRRQRVFEHQDGDCRPRVVLVRLGGPEVLDDLLDDAERSCIDQALVNLAQCAVGLLEEELGALLGQQLLLAESGAGGDAVLVNQLED